MSYQKGCKELIMDGTKQAVQNCQPKRNLSLKTVRSHILSLFFDGRVWCHISTRVCDETGY